MFNLKKIKKFSNSLKKRKDALKKESTLRNKVLNSGYFDIDYYLNSNPDVKLSNVDPVQHFMEYGWKEGRNPSGGFDIEYYFINNPKNRNANIDPISALLKDAERGHHDTGYLLSKHQIQQVNEEMLLSAKPLLNPSAKIVIIIPVYRGYQETIACINSVLRAENNTIVDLLIVNDCSPDEKISKILKSGLDKKLFNLAENPENMGFVYSVNKGICNNRDRDIILLNSDTHVVDNWVDSLLSVAAQDPNIGTITPLSNNATICSYPRINQNNSSALEINDNSLNEILRDRINLDYIEIPTGVGFCFFIRKELIQDIGVFDTNTFGKGYGEENDFCFRAKKEGWKNVLALNTFIRHFGEVSFQENAKALKEAGLKKLLYKHPSYLAEIDSFVSRDPIKKYRAGIDAWRIKYKSGKLVLFISHSWGGGIERHIRDLSTLLKAEDISTVTARSNGQKSESLTFSTSPNIYIPNLINLNLFSDRKIIEQTLKILKPDFIHVHSFSGLAPNARFELMGIIHNSGIPYYFTFHDYLFTSNYPHLVLPDGNYIGPPSTQKCIEADYLYKNENGGENGKNRSSNYKNFILDTAGAFAPSESILRDANKFLGRDFALLRPHPEPSAISLLDKLSRNLNTKNNSDKNVRSIGAIGAIGLHKGRSVLETCAFDAKARGLNLNFSLFGYMDKQNLSYNDIEVTGKYYSDKECLIKVFEKEIDFMVFFSIWPEIYNYALTLAFIANIPPVVFNLGAQAERVKKAGLGYCLPVSWINSPEKINDFLLSNSPKKLGKTAHRDLVASMDSLYKGKRLTESYYSVT